MQYIDLYFEDYQVGEQGETCGRTITEADLFQFACITGDFAPVHMDRDLMAKSATGTRVGHGWFGTCLAVGMLSYHAPHIVGRDTPTACLWDIESRYAKPIILGDTLRLQWSIEEKTPDLNQPGFGAIRTAYRLINQEGVTEYDGFITTEVRMRHTESAKLQFHPGVPCEFKEFIPDYNKVYVTEDFVIGEGWESYGRMITETDVVNLMGLTQDYDRIYVDSAYAKKTVCGERIVPWMLIAVIAIVLSGRDGPFLNIKKLEAPYIGHLNEKVSFLAPAKIGDVIHCRTMFDAIRISKTKPDRGIITFRQQAINQKDEVLMEIQTLFMEPTKAAAAQLHEISWVLSTTKGTGKPTK
jgi:3-hydroxybutyryl-CoA dehydratase